MSILNHHPNCSQCNSILAPETLIQLAAARLTIPIKSSGPHAATVILSSRSAFATTSRIRASTSGRPCATLSDAEDSHGEVACAVAADRLPFFSTSVSGVSWLVLDDLAVWEGGKGLFSLLARDMRGVGASLSLSLGGGGEGRVVWRNSLTRGLLWSSLSSSRNQDRFSGMRLVGRREIMAEGRG